MVDIDRRASAAILVGRLIRSYRTEARLNGQRLTQEGLLSLMSERGEDYAASLDRSAVSHWERGVRLAPKEFLEAFGRALDVPEREIGLMLVIAGHDSMGDTEGREAILSATHSIGTQVESVQRDVRSLMDSTTATGPSTAIKSTLRMAALPGLYTLAVGFLLNGLGLNGTAALAAYALIVASILTGQWVLRWRKSDPDTSEQDHIGGLFFITLFITLNSSVLIGAATKADHFGFYTLASFAGTPMPLLLAMAANLVLATAGSAIFNLLWNSQRGPNRVRNPFTRAILITGPPILFPYINIFVFTNMGAWIYFMIVFGVTFGAFATFVALNESDQKLENGGFLLKTTILVIVLLCSSGVAGILIMYLEPDLLMATSNFRIIPLPEVSHLRLGYDAEEAVGRMRLGMMFMSVATMVYQAIVLGGYLIRTVRRAAV